MPKTMKSIKQSSQTLLLLTLLLTLLLGAAAGLTSMSTPNRR